MKEIIVLLLILIQSQVTSDVILKKELIGTWKIEKVNITRPGVCFPNDINQIIGSTFTFTDEHLRYVTSNNKWFLVDNDNQLYWFIEDEYLIIKSNNHQEDYRSKITFEKGKLTLHLSNLITISLIRI
ncbi:hypothetical protein QSV08_16165 [Maribacter sp. BPC-D8]|uniref:hypothetical protein n=1 Tax=Maribacter sp. BPC-D8 TaxID=3053613 RepID=UPI002B4695AA|nr:hypothetical protein [Maribacter sp. BPC-D8]WRI28746.1 hypothetical protein QSV08_16165 [Maribacter sp. BPC-D8]